MMKALATPGTRFLISKSNQIMKLSRRTRTNGDVKMETSSTFQKEYRAWTKRDYQILLVICKIANNAKHDISREFNRLTLGADT